MDLFRSDNLYKLRSQKTKQIVAYSLNKRISWNILTDLMNLKKDKKVI
jgi:hypothetical protein